jgi:glucose-1-phosphate cytidylyltransferase
VGDVNIPELIKSHEAAGKYVTLTAVLPAGRFGAVVIDRDGAVSAFTEKPGGDGAWINGGFFVMEPQIFDYLADGAETVLERQPLEKLLENGQLNAYKHEGFWKAMDTLKDKNELTSLWMSGKAPWKLWQ